MPHQEDAAGQHAEVARRRAPAPPGGRSRVAGGRAGEAGAQCVGWWVRAEEGALQQLNLLISQTQGGHQPA